MSETFVRIKKNELAALAKMAPGKADNALNTLANMGLGYVVNSFGKAGSPAPPGEPPGIDTGTLKNSIHTRKLRAQLYAIRAGTEYALPLEVGTTRMAARPYMGPMARWLEGQIQDVFDQFLEK